MVDEAVIHIPRFHSGWNDRQVWKGDVEKTGRAVGGKAEEVILGLGGIRPSEYVTGSIQVKHTAAHNT